MASLRIDVFHHIEAGCEVLARLDAIEAKQDLIIANQKTENATMSQMDDAVAKLTADVAAERTVLDAAIVYAKGVPALIKTAVDAALAAGASAAQLQSVTDAATALEAQSTDLAAAIPANTPAAAPA